MNPRVNIDEKIGKTVGSRKPPGGLSKGMTPADSRAWQQAFRAPFIPRGVYRFTSHEQADAWLMKMITRIRPNSNPANPPLPTSGTSAES